MTWTRLGVLMDLMLARAVSMRSDVLRGIATAGAAPEMAARCTAAAEMFPQHTKTSTPGPVQPVVVERPGPVSLDELRAHTSGPGHSASAALPRAAVGPDPATPVTAGSGHPAFMQQVTRTTAATFVTHNITGYEPLGAYDCKCGERFYFESDARHHIAEALANALHQHQK